MSEVLLEVQPGEGGAAGSLDRPSPLGRSRTAQAAMDWSRAALNAVLWLSLAALILLLAGPRVLPFKTYAVMSGSMEPTIHVGSLVVLGPVDSTDLRVGDVITFDPPGYGSELVTHRIYSVEQGPDGPVFQTKGDANGTPDAWQIQAGNGGGYRVLFSVPYLGWITGAMLGKLVLLVVLTLVGAGSLLMRIWRTDERTDGEA